MITKILFRNKCLFSGPYLKKIQHLYAQKKYDQILEINGIPNMSKNQMKQKYYSLIKKYHSDNCQDDETKMKTYEQITKIIISSYHALDKKLFENRKDIKEDTYVEDQICMQLFGKKYNQAKYWMHQPGNQKAKQAFFDKLFKTTGKTNYYEKSSHTSTTQNYASSGNATKQTKETDNQSKPVWGLAAAGAFVICGLFWWSSHMSREYTVNQSKTPKVNKQKYSKQNVDRIQEKQRQLREQKANTMINSIRRDHPPSLKYPEQDPHIMKQLTQYSIGPDIHLYEVSPDCYRKNKQQIILKGLDRNQTFPITRIRPNTAMTLNLEAERALHNVYVKVKDLINEIEKNGKYTPPQIFIKFHGYVMFQIRDKPITLTNYKDTDYVSLFDLYFNQYSPIFMKKDNFCNYLVGKDEIEYFGWVHLNTKKCSPVYLTAGQKAAFFHGTRDEVLEAKNEHIWKMYYQFYQDRWRQGGNSRERAGI